MTELLQNYKECSFYRAKLCYRGTSYDSVSDCLGLSQVGILSKRLKESSWFLAWKLSSTYTYTLSQRNLGI